MGANFNKVVCTLFSSHIVKLLINFSQHSCNNLRKFWQQFTKSGKSLQRQLKNRGNEFYNKWNVKENSCQMKWNIHQLSHCFLKLYLSGFNWKARWNMHTILQNHVPHILETCKRPLKLFLLFPINNHFLPPS